MAGKFNHHLSPTQKVVIESAEHLSETFSNHHLVITMGPLPNAEQFSALFAFCAALQGGLHMFAWSNQVELGWLGCAANDGAAYSPGPPQP